MNRSLQSTSADYRFHRNLEEDEFLVPHATDRHGHAYHIHQKVQKTADGIRMTHSKYYHLRVDPIELYGEAQASAQMNLQESIPTATADSTVPECGAVEKDGTHRYLHTNVFFIISIVIA